MSLGMDLSALGLDTSLVHLLYTLLLGCADGDRSKNCLAPPRLHA